MEGIFMILSVNGNNKCAASSFLFCKIDQMINTKEKASQFYDEVAEKKKKNLP
jgi:hypothetical protein